LLEFYCVYIYMMMIGTGSDDPSREIWCTKSHTISPKKEPRLEEWIFEDGCGGCVPAGKLMGVSSTASSNCIVYFSTQKTSHPRLVEFTL
jgi:hypothetical protein